MPFRRIEKPERHLSWEHRERDRCLDPSHNPPTHIVLEPGEWEYTCPSCGEVRHIRVEGPQWRIVR